MLRACTVSSAEKNSCIDLPNYPERKKFVQGISQKTLSVASFNKNNLCSLTVPYLPELYQLSVTKEKLLFCLQIVVKKKKIHSDDSYNTRTESSPSRLNFDISYTPVEVSHINAVTELCSNIPLNIRPLLYVGWITLSTG